MGTGKLRVLIACEESQTVCEQFTLRGHYAMSCDLKPGKKGLPHYQGNVFDVINDGWDLMIGHPPCTYLTVTGNKWFKPEYKDRFPTREHDRQDAIRFFLDLYNCIIPKVCLENPLGIMSTVFRPPNQWIEPWMFGDSINKKTGLWLKGLQPLIHTSAPDLFNETITHVQKEEQVTLSSGKKMGKWYYETSMLPLKDGQRAEARSKTFPGIALAMAEQWG